MCCWLVCDYRSVCRVCFSPGQTPYACLARTIAKRRSAIVSRCSCWHSSILTDTSGRAGTRIAVLQRRISAERTMAWVRAPAGVISPHGVAGMRSATIHDIHTFQDSAHGRLGRPRTVQCRLESQHVFNKSRLTKQTR